ncbi:hypothetical protein TNCV_1651161 [Trichonephila clavipes]|nr:hypothetical protein TNCV_1651161 [Trichonephila clavipes]
MNDGHGQWNGTTLCFQTNPASGGNNKIIVFEFRDTMGDVGFHCRTSLVRVADTLKSQWHFSEVLEPVVLTDIQH